MKIRIKTNLAEIEIEDNPTIGSDNHTKRSVPELTIYIEASINQAIRLHNELKKQS